MPNPHRGEYEIELGGETRTFRYSLNKLAMLQDKLGVTSLNELVKGLDNLGFSDIRYMIWLGVITWNKEANDWMGPTEMEVGEWEIQIEDIAQHLKIALARAFRGGRDESGEDEEEEEAQGGDPPQTEETETPTEDLTSQS